MKKFTRIGMRYRIIPFSSNRMKYNHQEIAYLNFVIELKVFNTKTNREILFVTKEDDKVSIPVLKCVDKLGNSDYDVQKFLFVSEYIKASYNKGKIDISINNKDLEKHDYRIEYNFKEFSKNIVTDKVEIGGCFADVTTELKINSDEFKEILTNNKFVEDDKLMLDGTKSYEVNIK